MPFDWSDSDSSLPVVMIVALLCVTVLAWRGCDNEKTKDGQKAAVQVECLKAGNTVLECKEL